MGKTNKRMEKRARSWIALLLVFALLFAIDYFMNDAADLKDLLGIGQTEAVGPAGPQHTLDPNAQGVLDAYVLDVGQGDSIFLRSPSGKTMLVDASTSDMADRIDVFLQSQGVTKLDVVIGTHPHADHIGGMRKIISKYEVGVYYMPDAVSNTSTFEKLVDELERRNIDVMQAEGGKDELIDWDDEVEVRILSPLPDVNYPDLNNVSVVCRVRYGDTAILLTGDAETSAEKAMLREFPASMLRATVLKLGHHGSSTSTSDAFLSAVDPEIAIASLGAGNDYGHPHREIISKLESANIPLLRTDEKGTIHIALDGQAYAVVGPR